MKRTENKFYSTQSVSHKVESEGRGGRLTLILSSPVSIHICWSVKTHFLYISYCNFKFYINISCLAYLI